MIRHSGKTLYFSMFSTFRCPACKACTDLNVIEGLLAVTNDTNGGGTGVRNRQP